jgi:hypothetical protein
VGPCDYGNESSASIKGEEFPVQLKEHLKSNSVLWSQFV